MYIGLFSFSLIAARLGAVDISRLDTPSADIETKAPSSLSLVWKGNAMELTFQSQEGIDVF